MGTQVWGVGMGTEPETWGGNDGTMGTQIWGVGALGMQIWGEEMGTKPEIWGGGGKGTLGMQIWGVGALGTQIRDMGTGTEPEIWGGIKGTMGAQSWGVEMGTETEIWGGAGTTDTKYGDGELGGGTPGGGVRRAPTFGAAVGGGGERPNSVHPTLKEGPFGGIPGCGGGGGGPHYEGVLKGRGGAEGSSPRWGRGPQICTGGAIRGGAKGGGAITAVWGGGRAGPGPTGGVKASGGG